MNAPQRWNGVHAPFWSFPRPNPKTPKYDRLRVDPGGKPLQVVILSTRIEEIGTHFVDKRTVPCTGCQGECWLDHRLVGNARYSAWLAVRLLKMQRPHLLSLTKVAVQTEPRLEDPRFDLRGLTLRVWRLGVVDRSEMHAGLDLQTARIEDVPPCPDVRFLVERMLRADDRPEFNRQRLPGAFERAFNAAKGGGS